MAVEGDTVMVGRYFDDEAANHAGAVYVFERRAGEWLQVAKLFASDAWRSREFGRALAIRGERLVVGADTSAYVFQRDAHGRWQEIGALRGPPGVTYYYGAAVALDGDVVVVGDWADNRYGVSSGAAYVFEREPDGQWRLRARLEPQDARAAMAFGEAVAVEGDVALVGAPGADGAGYSTGAVYAFRRQPGGTWMEMGKFFSKDVGIANNFGSAVALGNGVAVVGDPTRIEPYAHGVAYVFVADGEERWHELAKLIAPDGSAWDWFGSSVALSGNVAVVGMWNGNNPFRGQAYFYAVGRDDNHNGLMDACECPGDINHDWIVDQQDLGILLSDLGCMRFTSTRRFCPGDLDGDGDTDQADLGILLARWNQICP